MHFMTLKCAKMHLQALDPAGELCSDIIGKIYYTRSTNNVYVNFNQFYVYPIRHAYEYIIVLVCKLTLCTNYIIFYM